MHFDSRRLVMIPAALAALLGVPLRAGDAAEPARDHFIFVGLDIAVKRGGVELPVMGADRAGLLVSRREGLIMMPSQEVRDFSTRAEPKVSWINLDLSDMWGKRTFSRANDPGAKAVQQQSFMYDLQTLKQDQAVAALNKAQMGAQAAQMLRQAGAPVNLEVGYLKVQAAASNFDSAFSDASPGRYDASGMNRDTEQYDGFDVFFRVSAPQEIKNAYAAVRLLLRNPGQSGSRVSMIKFFPLPDLDEKRRKVALEVLGLLPGFEIDSFELHVFIRGRELATSASSNRIAVSRDEAHHFLVIRYLGTKGAASCPAEIIPELVSAGMRSQIPESMRSANVQFAINETGQVTGVMFEQSPAPPSAELEAALRDARFYPALTNGKPAASLGTFALAEFLSQNE